MDRQAILDQYRHRIAAGERTRLYTPDLQGLIDSFLDRLKELDDQAAIGELCRAEIELLEEGYTPATIGKNYIPRYRQAILAATEEGRLPLTENTLLDYDYSKRNGEIQHFRGHYAYRQFKYDDAQYTAIAQADNQRNNQKQDSLQPVAIARYLATATALLESHSFEELAAAIAALTGRRFSEVMESKFEQTDHPYKLRFAGQLKKREAVEAFETLCLIPTEPVWNAIERFRGLERTQKLQGLSKQKINGQANKPVQRAVHECFGQPGIVPILAGESAVTIHNLRAIYAIVAVHFFCPPSRSDHRFLQEQLGHIIGKRNIQKLRNSPSTAHYFHYYLVDADGLHIGAKGVKLGEIPAIDPAPEQAIDTAVAEAIEPAPAAAIEPTEPPATEPTLPPEALPADTELPAATSAEETLPVPSELTTATPTAETTFMDSLIELTQTIGFLRREAEEHKQRAEALHSERDRLMLDVQTLRQRVSELEQAQQQRSTELEPLQQQIAQLQAENQAYRAKLDAFSQLLGQGTSQLTPATPEVSAPVATPPAAPATGEAAIAPAAPIDSVEPATPVAAATPARSIGTPPTKTAPAAASKQRGRKRSARGKLEAAVRFIQAYNETVDHEGQWALTQTLLGAITGSNVAVTVKPFWKEIEQTAADYNSDHAMDAYRQNYGRSEEYPRLREEFETWLDAQVE